jgi:cytochrome c oxidase subunit 2
MRSFFALGLMLAFLALTAVTAVAETIHPLGFPTPVGPVADKITWLYNVIFIIIAVIAVVVFVPIGYIMWRFRRTRVTEPATFSHHLGFELLWTIVPALICLFIAYESYRAMVQIRTMPADAMNVEVVAYQFGWNFYYPDASEGGKHVAAPEPTEDDAEISLPGAPRQTKTLVVPVGKPIVLHVTAEDVLHAFFVPHLGVKIDAIPGRINYAWFKADEPGNWLGQCAELCGQAHGEMFFRVKAVPQDEFDAFIKTQRVAAGLPAEPIAHVSPSLVVSGTSLSTPTAAVTATGATSKTSVTQASVAASPSVAASVTTP